MEIMFDEKESKTYKMDSAESNQIYYHEYKKLYEHSLLLSKQVAETIRRQQAIYRHLDQMNARAQEFHDFEGVCKKERRRKARRGNLKMQKNYRCPSNRCSNRYGSYSSLNVHIKQKHPQQYVSKRKSRSDQIYSSNQISSS